MGVLGGAYSAGTGPQEKVGREAASEHDVGAPGAEHNPHLPRLQTQMWRDSSAGMTDKLDRRSYQYWPKDRLLGRWGRQPADKTASLPMPDQGGDGKLARTLYLFSGLQTSGPGVSCGHLAWWG